LSTGAVPDDPTELFVAQRQALLQPPRRLTGSSRAPLVPRFIKSGSVPLTYDPRNDVCYQKIMVNDQGQCGSCYAQAVGHMMGIRKCLLDQGKVMATGGPNRRLLVDAVEGAESPTVEGGEAHHAGDQPASPRVLSGCTDSSSWRDSYGDGCPWYKTYDPGCKSADTGQRSHCKVSCGTCPPGVQDQQSTDSDWWYKYMPSVNDLAQCAKDSDGSMQLCDGGNPGGVWNNWMKDLTRNVWVMGASCKPYTMKCKSSKGVVNPLTGGSCSQYSSKQLWHKPCSCIPTYQRPTNWQCPSVGPSGSCGFDVPSAMFVVKGVQHGLSIPDAVKNYQRHMLEFGPIYLGYTVTDAFMNWDWKNPPYFYTGGGTSVGGHAVTGIGWGTYMGTDFWLIRNSWGADWADKGHFKFARGWNLDKMEAGDTAASMVGSEYKDWSPPFCQVATWWRSWGSGTYKLTLKVRCSKDCSLTVFTSNRLTDRTQVQYGVNGVNHNGEGVANTVVALTPFDIVRYGFGNTAGDMWVKIKADDGKGNVGTNTQFINIPSAPYGR